MRITALLVALSSSTSAFHLSSQRTVPSTTLLRYKGSDFDDTFSSNNDNNNGVGGDNFWSALVHTERWISDTLDRSNQAEISRQQQQQQQQQQNGQTMHFADEKKDEVSSSGIKDNPYARKEVSYVCEIGSDLASVVGGIFRRVREARELGERHGRDVESRLGSSSSDANPTTMRSTNVVVIPSCDELATFQTFDALVQSINQARRAARDFVVVKKKDDEDDGIKEWVVSINCAHLHPQYGTQTLEEQLGSMKQEEQAGEVDVNQQEYKKRRDEARRSPYPSVIVEVLSMPPPDFGQREATAASALYKDGGVNNDGIVVTSDDVRKLEALFAMSAATKKSSSDDPFYDALGAAFGNDATITTQTPLSMAQSWVLENDPAFNEYTSTFTKSDTRHVDAAYEYVFNNLAMLNSSTKDGDGGGKNTPKRGEKSYIVLPNFLPTSATSFDRFAGQLSNIIRVMPSLANRLMISTLHPEHLVKSTQSPVPIIVITWK